MARAFYSVVLCLTLGLLATMWLRPGIAQEIIDFAHSVVRAQSPDPQSVPQATPFNNPPYNNIPGPPAQPMPATRPVTWPGTPVDSYTNTVTGGNNTGVANQYGMNPSQPRPGITVWDPKTRSVVPAPGVNGIDGPPTPASNGIMVSPSANGVAQAPMSPVTPNQLPGAAFLPHATADGPGALYPPNVAPPANVQFASRAQEPTMQIAQLPMNGVAPSAAPGAPSPYNQPTGWQPPPTAAGAMEVAPTALPVGPPVGQQLPIAPQVQPQFAAPNVQVLPGDPKDVPDSQIIAKVGTEAILRSDIKAMAYTVIQQKKLEIPPEHMQEFFEMAERPLLKQLVEMKLVYNDAVHGIPSADAMKKIQGDLNNQFDKEQLPKLMATAGVSTRQELEIKLREHASSIEWERRLFFEKNVQGGWMSQRIKQDQEIPASDILGYYTQHLADYEFSGQAKWEELMVSFEHFPDKQAAMAMIVDMGNAVMRGAAFSEMAKARSDGITAAEGGLYNATTQGSLTSKELDNAIFQLPLNRLSQIIETDRGYHIVRVLQRKDAGRKTFEEVQTEIRKKLKEENFKKQVDAYLDELKQKTPVWTIYDDKPGGLEGPPREQ